MSTPPDASPEAAVDEPTGAPAREDHDKPGKPGRPSAGRARLSAAITHEGAMPLFLLAATWGALAATITALAAALWLLLREHQEWDGAERTGLAAVVIIALYALFGSVFLSARPGENRFADNLRVIATVIAGGAITEAILHSWWRSYLEHGDRPTAPILLAAAALLACTGWTASTLRLIYEELHHRRSRVDERADDAGPTDVMKADSLRRPGRRRAWATAVGGFCAPAVIIALITAAALAVLPTHDLGIHATVSTAEPVSDDALPATPTGAPNQVAWKTTAASDPRTLDVGPGARGPVILSGNKVQGLNGEDGSVLWTYQLERGHYIPTRRNTPDSWSALSISPDHRHAAFAVVTTDPSFPRAPAPTTIIILDTITGRPTAEHALPLEEGVQRYSSREETTVQLTDSAALIETEVISLADGARLGSVPDDRRSASVAHGTGGHSTFVLSSQTGDEGNYRLDLTLIPDGDLSTSTRLPEACIDPTDHDPGTIIQNGWVARCTEPQLVQPDDDASGSVRLTSWSIAAVNVDEFAAGTDSSTQEEIPMGRGLGVNEIATIAAGALTTIPDNPNVKHLSYPIEGDGPWTGQILDAGARHVIPAAESASLAAATFTASQTESAGAPHGFSVRATLPGGESGPIIPVPWIEMSAPLRPRNSQIELRKNRGGELSVLPVPGCTIILLSTDRHLDATNHQQDLMIVGVK